MNSPFYQHREMTNRERKEQKRGEAWDRNAAWAQLSDAEKLASLEARGHGHCKQAEQLREAIDNG